MALSSNSSNDSTVGGSTGSRDLHVRSELPIVNSQVAEKCVAREDGALEVVDIFLTIQGEGPFAGEPAVFVRTAGCVLSCPLCDTDYTSGRELKSVKQITQEVLGLINKYEREWLVVITGGEPLRQSCGPLVRKLYDEGLRVQIETNGMVNDRTLTEETAISNFTVVCSPKGSVHKDLRANIKYLKYVVKAGQVDESDGLPTSALDLDLRPERPWPEFNGKIYVQPCDEKDEVKNKANMQAAIKSCMDFGYTLSLQLHKYAGLA